MAHFVFLSEILGEGSFASISFFLALEPREVLSRDRGRLGKGGRLRLDDASICAPCVPHAC